MGQLHSIRYRRDTAANWASVNPVLQEGEPGYETDTGIVKIGDGATAYNSLGAIFHSEIEALENDINYATTIKQKAVTEEGGVFNGDFEYGVGSLSASDDFIGDKKYGWWLNTTGNAIASFDSVVSYNGGQSLKIELTDASATGIVSRNKATALIFPVKPSTKYRLSARIKTENAATDSVWFTSTQYDSDGAIIAGTWTAGTSAKLSGDNDWTYVEKIITTDASAVEIDPQFYHGVAGNIATAWFDDIKLEQIDTQTVNTQVATPASVSVTGVTTTDNVDQGQTTVNVPSSFGKTTGNKELAQSFVPAESHLTGVNIRATTNTGSPTDDITITIETESAGEPSGTVLASTVVTSATWTAIGAAFEFFDLPCILEVGTKYWIRFSTPTTSDTDYYNVGVNSADGYSDGTLLRLSTIWVDTTYDMGFETHFAKHTESPVIEANGAKLDLTGVKLLTGATIAVNKDGSGTYLYSNAQLEGGGSFLNHVKPDVFADAAGLEFEADGVYYVTIGTGYLIWKFESGFIFNNVSLIFGTYDDIKLEYSIDYSTWIEIFSNSGNTGDSDGNSASFNAEGVNVVYLRVTGYNVGSRLDGLIFEADLDCTGAQLPLMIPSSEAQTETTDLTHNPINISEGQFWQLTNDLTGWGSRTITMLASEALFESQTAAASTIYIYDSNGTGAWTWDDRNGLVPPADRTSGVVMAKFLVGDNQIKTSVNDGSMKGTFNISWDEESLRAAINRLTDLVNMQYPIVVEVEDVPAIDVQNEPTGASAETGYTDDVTSLRQTAAATPAIAYTGLTPREDRFSEWLDVIVVCDDGDGTLQGKLYTEGGTLIATYADLEANPVLSISNPDYKYSRERLVLQISASSETTSTAWSVSKITWRYQYNG